MMLWRKLIGLPLIFFLNRNFLSHLKKAINQRKTSALLTQLCCLVPHHGALSHSCCDVIACDCPLLNGMRASLLSTLKAIPSCFLFPSPCSPFLVSKTPMFCLSSCCYWLKSAVCQTRLLSQSAWINSSWLRGRCWFKELPAPLN